MSTLWIDFAVVPVTGHPMFDWFFTVTLISGVFSTLVAGVLSLLKH